MTKIVNALIVVVIIVGGYYFYTQNQNKKDSTNINDSQTKLQEEQSQKPQEQAQEQLVVVQNPTVTMETSMGIIKIELDAKAAPKTVANFIKLSKDGFYNGLKFHRVVRDFVIQGGDPEGTGMGGPGYTVPAEIGLLHKKGAIAMARTGDEINPTKASSGSQFYIALDDLAGLDGQYTVFGYVTSGMDVVAKIGQVPTEPGDYPLQDILINKITIEENK